MKIKQFVVDAFTDRLFAGNPAAVCVLEAPLSDARMQAVAIENNLSETAFLEKRADGKFGLRWFTPGGEIDLCGHATLGTAFVCTHYVVPDADRVAFETRSGELVVTRVGASRYSMDFPASRLEKIEVTDAMTEAFGAKPKEAYLARDLLCVFEDDEAVRRMTPDQALLAKLPWLLQHATAASADPQFDCVSRSFAPKLAVAEDPVCGSGHCHIVPYWAARLGKASITAFQASKRTGVLYCRLAGERIEMAGDAVLYSEAVIDSGEE